MPDALDKLRSGFMLNPLDIRIAMQPVCGIHPDLDQFMRVQCGFDLGEYRSSQAILAEAHDGFKVVSPCAQKTLLGRRDSHDTSGGCLKKRHYHIEQSSFLS
jgi:hypothetical protein